MLVFAMYIIVEELKKFQCLLMFVYTNIINAASV